MLQEISIMLTNITDGWNLVLKLTGENKKIANRREQYRTITQIIPFSRQNFNHKSYQNFHLERKQNDSTTLRFKADSSCHCLDTINNQTNRPSKEQIPFLRKPGDTPFRHIWNLLFCLKNK